MHACMRACVRACVRVCERERKRNEGSIQFLVQSSKMETFCGLPTACFSFRYFILIQAQVAKDQSSSDVQ